MSNLARERARPATWADFIALDEDDLRELIDGELVEVEVPTHIHEWIVATLVFFLVGFVRRRGGCALPSGYKVRVSDRRGVMPDVQLYRAGNEPVAQDQGLIRGRPDLVIEVVSPSSQRYDRTVKLGYYAALEVPEYWIVDPASQTVERLLFTKKGYQLASTHRGSEILRPSTLPGMKIPLADLWAGSVPRKKRVAKRR